MGIENAHVQSGNGRYRGQDFANKTGRVIGNYRGYPVILSNLTRDQSSGSAMMITGQTYYTEFRLTIQNPAEIRVTIRKDRQLTVEPQDIGNHVIGRALAFGRWRKLPTFSGSTFSNNNGVCPGRDGEQLRQAVWHSGNPV